MESQFDSVRQSCSPRLGEVRDDFTEPGGNLVDLEAHGVDGISAGPISLFRAGSLLLLAHCFRSAGLKFSGEIGDRALS